MLKVPFKQALANQAWLIVCAIIPFLLHWNWPAALLWLVVLVLLLTTGFWRNYRMFQDFLAIARYKEKAALSNHEFSKLIRIKDEHWYHNNYGYEENMAMNRPALRREALAILKQHYGAAPFNSTDYTRQPSTH